MTSYLGRHAELYDTFYADKPYGEESAFVAGLLERHAHGRRRLLDLACGTGGHAFVFEDLGYEVTGADQSPDMVAVAAAKAAERGSSVTFLEGDMTQLALGETFDVVTCLFDSLGYVQTNERLLAALRAVFDHVRPGGVFVYEVWHAAAMLAGFDPLRVRRWRLGDRDILRISETTVHIAQQTATVGFSIYEHGDDGTYTHLYEAQTNRFFLRQEFEALLVQSGLQPIECFGGFDATAPIDANAFHLVGIAGRP